MLVFGSQDSGRIDVYTRPNAPRSIGGVLDDGLKLWRQSLSKTWPLALIAQLLISVPLLMVRVQFKNLPVIPSSNAFTAANAANQQLMLAVIKSPTVMLAYLLAMLVTLACYTAIVIRIDGLAMNNSPSLGTSLSAGFRLLPRVLLQLLVFILAGIVIGTALAIFGGIVAGIATAGLGGAKSPLFPIVLLSIIFIIGCFVLGRVFLSFVSLVLDDAGAVASIGNSWRLTRGYWWRCSAILLVLVIIGFVFTVVIGFADGLVAATLGVASVAATALTQLVGIVSNAFLGSLYPAVFIAIFYDLKLRKQGVDLAGRVSALAPQ
jgi:hypothetical protein